MFNLDMWQWLCIGIIILALLFWWLLHWTGKKQLKERNERYDRMRADKLKHRQISRVQAPPMRVPNKSPVSLPYHAKAASKPLRPPSVEQRRRSRDVVQSNQDDDGLLSGLIIGSVIGSSLSNHSSQDTPYSGGGGEFGGGGASGGWDSSSSSDSGSSSCDSGGGGGSD